MKIHEILESSISELRKPEVISSFQKDTAGDHYNNINTFDPIWHRIDYEMAKKNFKKLGNGFYGSVYHNPKHSYVIKVFSKDNGFLTWMQFVKQNQQNPHVPKLKSKVMDLNKNFHIVRMELLKPISQKQNDEFISLVFNTMDDIQLKKPVTNKWIAQIAEIFNKYNHMLDDLDAGSNIMIRPSTNEVVVTDPFAG